MLKKITYFLLLFLLLIALTFSLYANIHYSTFDVNNVKNKIELLSSDTYSGRLAGTPDNYSCGDLIKKDFETSKLIPLNNNYEESFNAICPVPLDTTPSLKISKDNILIEALNYGKDFKEDMINFRNNSITFSSKDTINNFGDYIYVTAGDKKLLLYVPKSNDFNFRSSFSEGFKYDMAIMINTNAYNKILDSLRAGLTVSLNIPFTVKDKELLNIVGVIKGSSKTLPPLVFTAHYDHIGTDGVGNIYNGALDNASGTAFLLELQRTLSTYGTPKRDIIFVALNAEELGLLGSKAFAEANANILKGAEVINFDMIGSGNYPITFMLGATSKDNPSDLLSSVEKFSNKKKVPYEVIYQDSSDHASFITQGIDSLSFCHSDMSKIHTPSDTSDYIDTNAIASVYSVVKDKTLNYAYSPIIVFMYSKYSIIIFSSLLLLMLLFPTFIKWFKHRKK